MNISRHRAIALFITIYAVVLLYTLPRYGLIWDTYAEYPRAAAYVEWHVSGRAAPQDVPADEKLPWAKYTYEEAKASNTDSANGCLPSLVAALSGKLLYQKLHWLGPVDAYNCGLAFLWLLGLAVFYSRAQRVCSRDVAFLATATLALAPRLFEDAHNNMKDLPSSIFGALAVLEWASGIVARNPRRILLAGVWFGISLASKHTSLLLLGPMGAAILFVWISRRTWPTPGEILAIPGSLLISAAILFGHLPHLWVEPSEALKRVRAILAIGTMRKIEDPHVTDAALWLFGVTTPPVVLAGALLGAAFGIIQFRRGSLLRRVLVLTLLAWLAAVFGIWSSGRLQVFDGIRNFQHFWPALALLSSLGFISTFLWIARRFRLKRTWIVFPGCALVLAPIAAVDWMYHPHQIAYFNTFVGGLEGAQKYKDRYDGKVCIFEPLDYWGSSLRPCVEWANANLKAGSRVEFGLGQHIGKFYVLRPDFRRDCGDGDGRPCSESYVISIERPFESGPCDRFARAEGSLLFEEKMGNVRFAGVFKLPGGFNPCHNPPVLERVAPAESKGDDTTISLRLRCEPCAAGKEFYLFVGGRGEFPGAAFAGGIWAPLGDLLSRDPAKPEMLEMARVIPGVIGPSGVLHFSLSSSALKNLGSKPISSLAFVGVVGGAETGMISNTLDVPLN